MPIQRIAFQPSKDDTNGISVFREMFVTPDELDKAAKKPGNYFIVRLSVLDFVNQDLTVVPDPQGDQPKGHSLIPELHYEAMRRSNPKLKEAQRELAKLASKSIIYEPDESSSGYTQALG